MKDLLTCHMSVLEGVKEVVVGSKVSRSEFDILQAICTKEDRSMSYVLRELAIRGLAYYLQDGLIKASAEEDASIAANKLRAYDDARIVPTKTARKLNENVTAITTRKPQTIPALLAALESLGIDTPKIDAADIDGEGFKEILERLYIDIQLVMNRLAKGTPKPIVKEISLSEIDHFGDVPIPALKKTK